MRQEIQIGRKIIGPSRPLFIIAEVGVTCNYDLGTSKELIDVVSQAGADAIKFIFWFPEEILSDKSITFTYDTPDGETRTENMFEMLNKLRFSLDQWHELKAYADARGVTLFSTVNSPSGIEYTLQLGLDAFKLSSWDYNYFPLWRRIASLGKPMLIDTGPVTLLEVAKVLQIMQDAGNDQAVLLHCFHTSNPGQMNMRAIKYMRKALSVLVGFSSTGRDTDRDIIAVSLGAVVLEKRLTISRKLPGHHHVLSMEPKEFESYVQSMRDVQLALGECTLKPSEADLCERKKYFRHIVANRDIAQGEKLTYDMLECKRPEIRGISPEYIDLFIGREVKRPLKYNEAVSWEDI